ncbi:MULTISPECIES: RluA family pseudouridine synthase [Helicobacter]|uniref:RNA pseudouridylate synthase n=3 Tax=Helicobacter typhlonius TaxID=76936 RepID=A0A099UF51_9HELI|nr:MULTISPECIES: RluA family pseudouridine synthase [Helicobacter]TLD79532.1 RluA family pseudouridine synthase [Helicobacter typhlonius]TLD88359.1 RluA family pseudouridine synthase [Helicobacter sp. MIT 03-1616]CUU39349.1 Ribosomal large subunit pseudouridine synthase D [Helicobacter typhlonius]HCD73364.1 RluA family pseudouridine synthase [Helicobacter sp.]
MPFITREYEISTPIAAFLFLMRHKQYSIQAAQRAIDKGYLRQNGRAVSKAEIICGKVELNEFEARDINLEPLFSNADFCVYDKPHNLLSHPKGRYFHYSLNDALKSRFGKNANIIHRLDRQTSGLLLCALNPVSEKELKMLMQQRQIHKSYYAIVEGNLTQEILIDKPLATQKHKGGDLCIKSIICKNGKESRTLVRPIFYHAQTDSTLINALPLTGRTHQIRAHCAYIGHRILGDPLYGADEKYSRMYLDNKHLAEYEQYFGAPYLCLNAHSLHFCFREQEYRFTSKLHFDFAPHFEAYF